MTSTTRRTVTRPSTLLCPDVLARVVAACALVAGCINPPGNDPNVPDQVPDGTVLNLESTVVCPPAAPSSCPETPSFAKDIAPLVKRACLPCHSPGGVAADRDLTTYANLIRLETTDFVQVDGCVMPPADAGPDASLSFQDRTEFLQWFVCGSPDN
jgi:hypothetical protein